jgi:hypothetical protein
MMNRQDYLKDDLPTLRKRYAALQSAYFAQREHLEKTAAEQHAARIAKLESTLASEIRMNSILTDELARVDALLTAERSKNKSQG